MARSVISAFARGRRHAAEAQFFDWRDDQAGVAHNLSAAAFEARQPTAPLSLVTGPANGVSKTPVLTPDGRYVAFVSSATDLVETPVNGNFQIYVRDLVAGTTRLVTLNRLGQASSAPSAAMPYMRAMAV